MQRRGNLVAVLGGFIGLVLLWTATPALAEFEFIEQGGDFRVVMDGSKKSFKRNVNFLWVPEFPNGAPNGYNVAIFCFRSTNGKGKVTTKNLRLRGADTNTVVNVPNGSAKWKRGEAFDRMLNSFAPQALAGESAVLVSGEVSLNKKFKNNELVVCRLYVAENGN